ncbi:DUF58 domain-containing protein [Smaragdicoccus niigatensis]|uniref:DUF58 domain-containing protein n=1 Tax=Smaragdicoccus niigatensis TaxID=359359 RepID=UPI0003636A72|nr:DUF58 domain-containing protein [Smaragdicoccus niigatensis]
MTITRLDWRPAPVFGALAMTAGVALSGAVMVSRPVLIAFAAPFLAVLIVVGRTRLTTGISIDPAAPLTRCFEGETVSLRWGITAPENAEIALEATGTQVQNLTRIDGTVTADITVERWGNYALEFRVKASTGMWIAEARVRGGSLRVYPYAQPEKMQMPVGELPRRIGTHLSHSPGSGVEFAGIRPFQAGDALRMVNWVVSARRADMHVNERLTERSADVSIVVDTYAQQPGPAGESLERCVHGAVSTAQSALRRGDRAALVCLGSRTPRWLAPQPGRRQFYQVLDAVLEGEAARALTGTLVPRAAAPPGSVVVAFSPLLDAQFGLALVDLRRRGHPVLAVDVLSGPPFGDDLDPLIARMWRLERGALYRDLSTAGIEVVQWENRR